MHHDTRAIVTDNHFSVIPHWVIFSGISDGALRLYAILQKYADNSTGKAFPSRATLAKDTHKSPDSVDRYIKELRDLGALKVTQRRKSGTKVCYSNLYTVITANPNVAEVPELIEVEDTPVQPTAPWVAAPVRPGSRVDAAENYTHSTTPTKTSEPSVEAEKTAAPHVQGTRATLSLTDQLNINDEQATRLLRLSYQCWRFGDEGPWDTLANTLETFDDGVEGMIWDYGFRERLDSIMRRTQAEGKPVRYGLSEWLCTLVHTSVAAA